MFCFVSIAVDLLQQRSKDALTYQVDVIYNLQNSRSSLASILLTLEEQSRQT